MKNPSLIGAGLMAAALLAGCGGGDSIYTPPAPAPAPTPLPMVDAFFATMQAAIAAMPEDAEAVGIDAIVATAPEDSEPVAL